MHAPSGRQHALSAHGYDAVVTESGATLRALSYDGRALLDGFGEDEMASAGRGQVLAPWPNRVRDGQWSWRGHDLQLPLSEPARHNASHGLVRWASWRTVSGSSDSVTLGYRLMAQSGWPWTLELEQGYALGEDGLTVSHTMTNTGDEPAPYAVGFHPYLTAGPSPLDTWELRLPGSRELLVDDRMIPVGEQEVSEDHDFRSGRPIGTTTLDTAYGDLARDDDGLVRVHLTDTSAGTGVVLWADGSCRWLQAYSADDQPEDARRRSLAVEPMTAPPDALRSGRDLHVVEPGERWTVRWGLTAV